MADDVNIKKKSKDGAARKKTGNAAKTAKAADGAKGPKASKADKTAKSAKSAKAKKKAADSGKISRTMRFLPGSDDIKLVVNAAVVAAALLSLLLLVAVGADLRPSALVEGYRNKYAFIHASGDGFPVDITGGRIISVSGVSSGTAVLTTSKCLVLDGKGRTVTSEGHLLASPAMETSCGYILLFDSLGKDYSLRTLAEEKCSGETNESIICADVSRSGVFALVTKSETNNARLIVLSPDGKTLHKWKSVSYKISDVSVSPSGKYVAICGLSAQNGNLVSTVILQRVGAKENLKEYTFADTLITDIAFDGNSRLVVVGDDLAAYISIKNDKDNKIYGYDGRVLNSYDISEDGELALVFSAHSDGRNSSVVVIGDDCAERAHIETDITSPYVDLEDGRISLLYQSGVSCYNYKGKLLGKFDVQADCQSIFTSGGSLLAKGVMYLNRVG